MKLCRRGHVVTDIYTKNGKVWLKVRGQRGGILAEFSYTPETARNEAAQLIEAAEQIDGRDARAARRARLDEMRRDWAACAPYDVPDLPENIIESFAVRFAEPS